MVGIETSVGPALLKSVPAKVTRQGNQYRIIGAAWGAPIAKVEVRIDDGAWSGPPSTAARRLTMLGGSGPSTGSARTG